MRVAIIIHRYGSNIAGGAETLARGLAENGAKQGWQVEVWTTCVRNLQTWANEMPAIPTTQNGVCVCYFPIDEWDVAQRTALESRLFPHNQLSPNEQYAWFASGPTSTALYKHIDEHINEFDMLLVLPYLMPVCYYAAWVAPEKTIVLPCLHDEGAAYLEPVRLLLESVRGVLFNSPEEAVLAVEKLKIRPKRYAALGVGVEMPAISRHKTQNFPSQTSKLSANSVVRSSTTYLLYVGRLEAGKNVATLYDYVQRFADSGDDIHLIVAGQGTLTPPGHPAFTYLGYVSDVEKYNLCVSALALCQPSLNESFSLTIMESWLAERPVLVHENCSVTQAHVKRSQGGLWFGTYHKFVGVVEWLLENPEIAGKMGQNGRRYVIENYTWDKIIKHFEEIVSTW